MKTPVMKPVTTLLALAWLTSSVALAQTPGTAAAGQETERMDRMALLLDLDAYQKTEVEKILKEHHEKMRSEFEAARSSGTRPAREEMEAKREASQQELHTKLSGVLNETQLKKFDALHEGRGPGPGRFGGKKDRASKTDSTTNN
jgi:hypothetical protein